MKSINGLTRAGLAGSLVLAAASVAGAGEFEYTFEIIPTLAGGDTFAIGISETGQVTGHSPVGLPRAFRYTDGSSIDVGSLGDRSYGRDINSDGVIIGYTTDAVGRTRAFMTDDEGLVDLGTLGGQQSWANGNNDAGQIVGDAIDALGNRRAFRWQNGSMISLGSLGGPSSTSSSQDINELGQVVGWSELTPGGAARPFFWDGDEELTNITGFLGSEGDTVPFQLNDHGDAVGYSFFLDGTFYQAVYWDNLVPRMLPDFGYQSTAWSINNDGIIVGEANLNPALIVEAVMWTDPDEEPILLKDLVESTMGLHLVAAVDINNNGDITGYGLFGTQWRSFVMRKVGTACEGDLDGSGGVDVPDLLELLANWGTSGPGADLAAPEQVVDAQDLLVLLAAWGPCP